MSAYTDAVAAVRRARIARDSAAGALYALELRRLAEKKPPDEAVRAQRDRVHAREKDLRASIAALHGRLTPQQLIEAWDDSLPIVLLPLRLETRWRTDDGTTQLLVRVFPDDVAITTHEKTLTDAEVEHGRSYWTAFQQADSDEAAEDAAWNALSGRFGANRAAWVAHETRPVNWAAAAADPTIPLQFPDAPLTKPDAWTTAPHSRVMPDRYVLMAWRGDEVRVTQIGAPIDDIVIVGPSPLEDAEGDASIVRDDEDNTLTFGESFRWVRDLDIAVTKGMAFRVAVNADDVARGFDRLLVLGLKHSSDSPDAQALIEALIDGHHYSAEGFELLSQGTPTNNTDANGSGFTASDRGTESTVAEAGPARFTPVADRASATDGQRLGDFLGLSYAPLLHAHGADHADHAEAVAMNRALYAGTLGYYVDHMLNEVVDDFWLGALRRHFTDHVTGRGPIAAIRVGNQPYGILPTSSLSRWQATRSPNLPSPDVALEPGLLRVLRRFDEAWSTLVPGLVQVMSPGDGTANLLQILGLHPNSAEFYQRVGYSYDYLKNLENFTWGGTSFSDAIKMLIEAAAVRDLLLQLGYSPNRADGTPKPLFLLLQLIWRHYHTKLDPKQLIDGLPFSETTFIKPYDAGTGATYLDWLLANASDATALETQDFGGAPKPGSLLYLMLHFSVVMEASHGIHRWLGSRDVDGAELVRSRKFLNVGAAASPSVWEIFRAPANRIVATEASNLALLEVIHAPQVANDAGQSVQEQRAAIDALRAMPTARLERALVEHIDTLSYRLDAWETSLFARRLHRQRRLDAEPADRKMGVYLGAYGYLENVKPAGANRQRLPDASLPEALRQGAENLYTERTNGGYVHAPSLNHATAAALLRSGYLTHATPSDPNALAVNLSSGRVEKAQALVDGIRNGQSLEVLLGAQFERGLHDWTTRPTPVILNQLKPLFRTRFPILRTGVPQMTNASSGATEVTEDFQVTNGLTLARTMAPFPYGIPELSVLSVDQRSAIQAEKVAIENTLDALRDALTTESAYQLALGNFDRAAAVLQSTGSGTIPPDIEVLATPRGTNLSFMQRLAVQLDASVATNPWPPVPLTERAKLEPALNAWLGDLLGNPSDIECTVSTLDDSVGGTVSVADLGLQPIDFVYVVRNQVEQSGAAELETRVRYAFARANGVVDDVVVKVSFVDAGDDDSVRSFAEVLPLADRLRRVLGTARPLDGRHFQSASKDPPPPDGNLGRVDAAELRTRVGTRLGVVRGLVPTLQSAVNAVNTSATTANVEALRDALVALANAGVSYAFPRSAVGSTAIQIDALAQQATAVLSRTTALDAATDDKLAAADAATNTDTKLGLLGDVVKAWMGGDTLVLPRFVFPNASAVAQADAARDELLSHVRDTVGAPLPVEEWLHGAACVRPLVHGFEMIRLMADAIRDEPLALSAIQLPFRTGDSWLGAEFPESMQIVHDTVSVMQHLPQGFDAAGAQCGLLIDEWLETIPSREEVTGLAFNFNAPNSAPPQALLLAVTPNETGSWQWDDLVDSVLDTFRRARLRAVEPDALGDLGGIGTLLPALVAEFGTSRASVSLDYSFVLDAIRVPVTAMSANPG